MDIKIQYMQIKQWASNHEMFWLHIKLLKLIDMLHFPIDIKENI